MPTLHAQPYDTSARGFYFENQAEYDTRSAANRNSFGGIVEEYEIQFIDGDDLDGKLFQAAGVNQSNVSDYFDACETWDDDDKLKAYFTGQDGDTVDLTADPDRQFGDFDLYEFEGFEDYDALAGQFVDDGLYGDIPQALANYIDLTAIGRDLRHDYSREYIDGTTYFYRRG